MGVSGFLISCATRRATSRHADLLLGGQEVGEVLEHDDVAESLWPVFNDATVTAMFRFWQAMPELPFGWW